MQIRTVGKNVLIYAIGIVALRGTALLLIPLYTHFLTIEDFGILSTVLITTQLMQIFMPLGTWDSVCKFYENYKNTNMISDLFGTSLIVNLFGGILTSILALMLFLPLFNKYISDKNISKYVFLACIISLAQSLCQLMMAYYRAENKAINYMLSGTMSSLILLVLTPIFIIMLKKGIAGALYAQVIAYLAVFFVIFVKIKNKYKIAFSLNTFRSLISFGIPLVFSLLSMFIIQSSCIYFLGYFGTLEDTAIFSLGSKFSAIMAMLITSPFQLAFAPYFYAHSHNAELKSFLPRIFLYMNILSIFLCYLILFLFKLFFPLIAPLSYFASYTVCLFLIPSIVFLTIKVIGETILYNFNKTACAGAVSSIFASINLLLNYLLIPHFKIYGAVASSALTIIFLSLTIFRLGAKAYPFSINFRKFAMIMVLLASLILSFFLIRNSNIPIFLVLSLGLFIIIVLLFYSNLFFESTDRPQIKEMLFRIFPMQRNI